MRQGADAGRFVGEDIAGECQEMTVGIIDFLKLGMELKANELGGDVGIKACLPDGILQKFFGTFLCLLDLFLEFIEGESCGEACASRGGR